jgi:hypothetical protein
VGDGSFLRLDAEPVADESGPVTRVKPEVRLRTVRVHVRSTPTLTAYGRVVTMDLVAGDEAPADRWHDKSRPAQRSGPAEHAIRTFIDARQEPWLEQGARVLVGFRRGEDPDTPGGVHRLTHGRLSFPFAVDAARRQAILDGRLDLDVRAADMPEAMVTLRVVDGEGAGLPWVEASLLTEDEDVVARRMLAISHRLAAAGTRDALERAWIPETFDPLEFDDSLVELTLGTGTTAAFPDPGLRRRRYEQGAWYDTHDKDSTDACGYLFLSASKLAPGRRMVLYLWSRSRDDLAPDRRIVFEAAPRVTDLGLIRMEPPRR